MKNTNRSRRAALALVILAFVITGVFLAFLPEQIPAHFNARGQADRFGSKYEALLLPAVVTASGLCMGLLARLLEKKGQPRGAQMLRLTNVLTLVLLNGMTVMILWMQASYDSAAPQSGVDLEKLTAIGLGVLTILLCNQMPRAPRNGLFGLRTGWSMKNDRVWQQCQRFAGYSGIVCGFVMVLSGCLLRGLAACVFSLALLLVWSAVCIAASKRICERDAQRPPET